MRSGECPSQCVTQTVEHPNTAFILIKEWCGVPTDSPLFSGCLRSLIHLSSCSVQLKIRIRVLRPIAGSTRSFLIRRLLRTLRRIRRRHLNHLHPYIPQPCHRLPPPFGAPVRTRSNAFQAPRRSTSRGRGLSLWRDFLPSSEAGDCSNG